MTPAALRTVQAGYLYLEQAVTAIEWGEGLALRDDHRTRVARERRGLRTNSASSGAHA
jgi:hypothetical protein